MNFPNREQGDMVQNMVESIVLDWLNKYPLESEDNHLSVKDPYNADQVRDWVAGVWGRISHQLTDSGFPGDNKILLKSAREIFNNELSKHPWYEQIKINLPKEPPSTGWLE